MKEVTIRITYRRGPFSSHSPLQLLNILYVLWCFFLLLFLCCSLFCFVVFFKMSWFGIFRLPQLLLHRVLCNYLLPCAPLSRLLFAICALQFAVLSLCLSLTSERRWIFISFNFVSDWFLILTFSCCGILEGCTRLGPFFERAHRQWP